MAVSTSLATPLQSPSSTIHTPLSSKMKVELGIQSITIFSDNSNVSSSQEAIPTKYHIHVAPNESPTLPALHPSLRPQSSFVDCLKKLRGMKDSRNALKVLDYNTVKHLKVDYLPPIFNDDVIFQFPLIGSSIRNSNAKLMVGMDKQHNGQAQTRTSTFHITKDISLTFCTASYIGYLHCNNQYCKYLNRIHCTSPLNETKWNGFTTTLFQTKCLPPSVSSIVCKICKTQPSQVATYEVKVYYVFGKDHMTRACVHFRVYEHPVKVGEYQDFKGQS